MLFVPLPLFATLSLLIVLAYILRSSDMSLRANQLFATLIGLYALQTGLLCLRWGYGINTGLLIAAVAPLLPATAMLAYQSLVDRLHTAQLWPLALVGGSWAVLALSPDLADPVILLIYLGCGTALVAKAIRHSDALALVHIDQSLTAQRAMLFTGVALIASAAVDLYVIADFIRTGGQNLGLTLTLVQSVFLLCIGLAATAGPSAAIADSDNSDDVPPPAPDQTEADSVIIARLTALFTTDALHQDTDLNLRRLSRRLQLPDRAVSQAVNRTQNMSVSQFVNTFRIRDACALLQDTDQSILQISLAAGFLTKSNFNREFSRITGQTPSKWRQANRPAP